MGTSVIYPIENPLPPHGTPLSLSCALHRKVINLSIFFQLREFFIAAIKQTLRDYLFKSKANAAERQSPCLNMQSMRNSILSHVNLRGSTEKWFFTQRRNVFKQLLRQLCASTGTTPDQIMDQVIGLVKKFDKIDAAKVSETADFQKDLCLDSLDRVELVMAFEQEFSIEIPDEKADKLTCCADVAKHIASEVEKKIV